MSNLKGQIALVTGAASKRGMGHAIALRLAREGADVAIMDKFSAPRSIWPGDEGWGGLETEVGEIEAMGRKAIPLVADVSKSQDVDAAVAAVINKLGYIDILVHGGGIRGPMMKPIVELSEDEWKNTLDVNLTGSFLISKAVAKHMIANSREGKKIVLIGSKAATEGYKGSSAYCASKHGVIGLTKTLALELAPYKINVNAINPGAFDTNLRDSAIIERAKSKGISVTEMLEQQSKQPGPGPQIPLGRSGTPEEIADLVFFLVSDQSNYITGKAIDIDGGLN